MTGERLRAVAVGSIIALVSEMPRLPSPTEGNLRKYDRVIRALSRRTPALLPARYGTRVRDLDELALILGSRQQSLRRRLKAVRNRVQMTVRLLTADPHETHVARTLRVRAGEPDPPSPLRRFGAACKVRPTGEFRSHTGADYLRTRAREAARERHIPQFDPLRAAVRRWVRAERVERRGAVATVYHLIPHGSVDAYQRALERKARDEGVRVLVSGPWPAYAFADPA